MWISVFKANLHVIWHHIRQAKFTVQLNLHYNESTFNQHRQTYNYDNRQVKLTQK